MKTTSELLTAADFFDKLQHEKIETASLLSFTGMVKKSEENSVAIEFAQGGTCSNWVTIPLDFIENAEVIKTVSCKDHSHPLVKLSLKAPRTPEAKLLLELFQLSSPKENGIRTTPPVMEPDLQMARKGPRFGGIRTGIESSTCLWTYVEDWVCVTVGNTTTCSWVGSWKCI